MQKCVMHTTTERHSILILMTQFCKEAKTLKRERVKAQIRNGKSSKKKNANDKGENAKEKGEHPKKQREMAPRRKEISPKQLIKITLSNNTIAILDNTKQ